MSAKLLASAGTVEGIETLVNRFWSSTAYRVDPDTLAITHPAKEVSPAVRVVKVGKRYRFEMEV